jgi:hypothetical protein
MLSYILSIVAIIVFIIISIILLFRHDFPGVYRFLRGSAKVARRGVRASVDRLGCLRFLFFLYLGFALIFSLVVLINVNGQNWLQSVGKLTIAWIPVLILRFILRWLSVRRERRLRLPGRER